ncbi:probable protein phosphatase 2C 68 [Aristolochia californica]|uniref:probable protein phosphatase 2C 68 n=1 Tax=Aristolochia californica TaxID=171875 RepID=UPI0035E15D97
MAEICVNMARDDSSPEKCREARRRRIEVRRAGLELVENWSGERWRYESDRPGGVKRNRTDGSSSSATPGGSESAAPENLLVRTTSSQPPVFDLSAAYGVVSLSGRSRDMEDAVSVGTDFLRSMDRDPCFPMHFFGVFDGHGGAHVAMLCKEQMHVFMAEELGVLTDSGVTMTPVVWNAAMARSFERMDELVLGSCACGATAGNCGCDRSGVMSEIVGSTAVVAVVSPDSLVVANCGDSRAVLSRGGRAIPLSDDHKPDRPDELARIEAAGGHVIYLNGARVQGILAMSRALGDKYLKPYVISEPEVNITERTPDDEFIILASDGLWDVLSNELACNVVRRCLTDAGPSSSAVDVLNMGATEPASSRDTQASHSRSSLAAALLTRLALGRKSSDNISVIVIDLKCSRRR